MERPLVPQLGEQNHLIIKIMTTYNSYTYVIINKSEVSSLDYSKLLTQQESHLRYSVDGSKALVKYSGDQPSELSGKTTYTNEEILEEMVDNPVWVEAATWI